MKYTKSQVHQISKGDEEISDFISMLLAHIDQLEKTIDQMNGRVKELERQTGSTSRNSSKPPSSDGFRKPTTLRQKGGKKGAPKGHDGHTLKMSGTPDQIEWHEPAACAHCQLSLANAPIQRYKARQVVDLPAPRLVFTEHRVATKCCPNCQKTQSAAFPGQVNAPIQYGESWSAWSAYLHTYQHLPLERITDLFEDLTGHRPSEATLLAHLDKLSDQLEPIERIIKEKLAESAVIHADETGMRIESKLNWLHTICNERWTFYDHHPKRGKEAMDAIGFLPFYKGVVIHDFWKSYFNEQYHFTHALCGVHLLRECQGIIDYDHHQWTVEMQALLREAWREIQTAATVGRPVEPETISSIESRYDDILRRGRKEWHTPMDRYQPRKRGRVAKSKAENLAERLLQYKADILRFLRHAQVPFDNNRAERDIRMMKVKEKISGSFRTEKGAKQFVRIRGFISTARKQGLNLLDSLILVNRGQFSFS